MTEAAALELRRVTYVRSSRTVLSECDLRFDSGGHTALLGVSGSGKSTVLRLLAGLEAPGRGEVYVSGTRASEANRILLAPHRRGIAMVFQDLGLWPNLDVRANVLLGSTRPELAIEALRLCRIERLADRLPGSLSGGEQQRVALARAVAGRPRFLLLDEPFAGLDLVTKRELLADVVALANARGATLILVTHDPGEALTVCSRAVVLAAGRVENEGPWSRLLGDPRSELLRAFRDYFQVRT